MFPAEPRIVIRFSIDPTARIRTAVYSEVVDDAGLVEAYRELLAEPGYDPTLNDLVDLRTVTRLEVSSETLQHVMSLYTPVDRLGLATRLAFVAGEDYTFGMSRMYELLRGSDVPEEIRVFRSHADAVAWLSGPGSDISG